MLTHTAVTRRNAVRHDIRSMNGTMLSSTLTLPLSLVPIAAPMYRRHGRTPAVSGVLQGQNATVSWQAGASRYDGRSAAARSPSFARRAMQRSIPASALGSLSLFETLVNAAT